MANEPQSVEFDYSAITEPVSGQPSAWEAPRHVYFGPRDQNTGRMAQEPVYTHKSFPAMLYKKAGGRVVVQIAQGQADMDRMKNEGFTPNLAELGIITAPSHDQIQALKAGGTSTITVPQKAQAKAA